MSLAAYFGSSDPFVPTDLSFHAFDNVFDRAFDRAQERGIFPGSFVKVGSAVGDPETYGSFPGSHPMDLVETPNAFEFYADAPGMTPGDIKVELDQNTLRICGEHKEEKKYDKEGKVWRQERSFRKFNRSFTLPENTKADGIAAELEHGVLKVVVPKKPVEKKPEPRRITVESSTGKSAAKQSS